MLATDTQGERSYLALPVKEKIRRTRTKRQTDRREVSLRKRRRKREKEKSQRSPTTRLFFFPLEHPLPPPRDKGEVYRHLKEKKKKLSPGLDALYDEKSYAKYNA